MSTSAVRAAQTSGREARRPPAEFLTPRLADLAPDAAVARACRRYDELSREQAAAFASAILALAAGAASRAGKNVQDT